MRWFWKKFTVLSFILVGIILFLPSIVKAEERVVLLAPAAADVLEKLDVGNLVVGVTNSVEEFPSAKRVGTHITPSLEIVASLRPTLLITTERFPKEVVDKLNAKHFIYAPKTLEEILLSITRLADVLGVKESGKEVVRGLEEKLKSVVEIKSTPSIYYETRSTPLSLAGRNTIMKSVLEHAGFNFIYPNMATTQASAEYILKNQPDYYIYQVGPMNKNPISPELRRGWQSMRSCVWRVDEKIYARANTLLFDEVLRLNEALAKEDPCKYYKQFEVR